MNSKPRQLLRIAKSSVVALVNAVAIYLFHATVSDEDAFDFVKVSAPDNSSLYSPFNTVSLDAQLDAVISATKPVLSSEIESLSQEGKFQRAKDKLLDRALDAVAAADNDALAYQLSELGELALLQGDLGMAEVYLQEALELYEEGGDEIAVAGIHVQKGRLHLFARKRARVASDAYDQLLISRWKISKGRFSETESPLRKIVADNLELNRYSAAASAYETLFSGYGKDGLIEQAHTAGVEAIKLYAASGHKPQVDRLLGLLKQQGYSDFESNQLSVEIAQYYREYEASVQAIGAARDYAQLYNQLSSKGDALQAWRFRRQAEQSLSSVNKRARYRRQPDVLVELYRSNWSMDSAITSLQKASEVYSRYGMDDGVQRSRQLREQIF